MLSANCPFEKPAKKSAKEKEVIEQIDIGGPSLVRAGAKNYKYACSHRQRGLQRFPERIRGGRRRFPQIQAKTRIQAFERIVFTMMRSIISKITAGNELLKIRYEKVSELRYGENPHQKAWFFKNPVNKDSNVTNSKLLSGKQLSFNNL